MTIYQQLRADNTNFTVQYFCISLIFTSVLSELLFRNDADCFYMSLIHEFVIQEDYIFKHICLLPGYYVAYTSVFLLNVLCFL